MNDDLIQKLERIRVEKLSGEEREMLWASIKTKCALEPTPSGFFISEYFMLHRASLATVFAALILLFGGGVTVAKADNARPGDALFGVDRVVENVRVALASKEKKIQLRTEFARERVEEFVEILSEEKESSVLARGDAAGTAPEARMAKTVPSPEDVEVEMTLMMASAPVAEEDALSEESRTRVAEGLSYAVSYLAEVSDGTTDAEALNEAISLLNEGLFELPAKEREELRFEKEERDGVSIRAKIRERIEGEEVEDRVEIERDGVRTKVEYKDGRVRIETRRADDSREDEGDSEDDGEVRGVSKEEEGNSNDSDDETEESEDDDGDTGDEQDESGEEDEENESDEDEDEDDAEEEEGEQEEEES